MWALILSPAFFSNDPFHSSFVDGPGKDQVNEFLMQRGPGEDQDGFLVKRVLDRKKRRIVR